MPVLPRDRVLLERRGFAELAVRFNRDADAASAGVVGGEDVLARRIDDEMARRTALRRLRVEECQVSRLVVDGERADVASSSLTA